MKKPTALEFIRENYPVKSEQYSFNEQALLSFLQKRDKEVVKYTLEQAADKGRVTEKYIAPFIGPEIVVDKSSILSLEQKITNEL